MAIFPVYSKTEAKQEEKKTQVILKCKFLKFHSSYWQCFSSHHRYQVEIVRHNEELAQGNCINQTMFKKKFN